MDPDLNEKIKFEIQYLDELIKGESIRTQELN